MKPPYTNNGGEFVDTDTNQSARYTLPPDAPLPPAPQDLKPDLVDELLGWVQLAAFSFAAAAFLGVAARLIFNLPTLENDMEVLDYIQEVAAATDKPATDKPTTELAPIERAALALKSTKTEEHLTALATKHASITLVKDKAGREQAHGAYMEVMRARTAVDNAAKDAREDANKFSKAVIAEAARLVAIIKKEEERLKAVRDVWDTEQERIKAEAEAKERARILAITERIAAIKSYVVLANNCRTSERVADLQTKLAGVELLDFEEFTDEAAMAHADATAHLHAVLTDRQAQEAEAARIKAEQEAEAARLKAEREELARQQAEAAAAIKKQQDELDAQRAEAAAEAQRVADEARAQADAAEAKVRAAAEALAAERTELDRMRAELEAKSKPVEQEASKDFHRDAEPDLMQQPYTSPMFRGLAPEPFTTSEERDAVAIIVQCDGQCGDTETVHTHLPPAPVASAIVLAVAEFWGADTKTAARWITERASEIEALKG